MLSWLLPTKSIWVVHNPNKRSVWCSKSDCPKLGRKSSYDVVINDDDLGEIIKTGVSKEESEKENVSKRSKRVGAPTVKLHDLGVVAAFRSKKKALNFMDKLFKDNQGTTEVKLELSEINIES